MSYHEPSYEKADACEEKKKEAINPATLHKYKTGKQKGEKKTYIVA